MSEQKNAEKIPAEKKDMLAALQEFLANADAAEILQVLGTVAPVAEKVEAERKEKVAEFSAKIAAKKQEIKENAEHFDGIIRDARAERDANYEILRDELENIYSDAEANGCKDAIPHRGRPKKVA